MNKFKRTLSALTASFVLFSAIGADALLIPSSASEILDSQNVSVTEENSDDAEGVVYSTSELTLGQKLNAEDILHYDDKNIGMTANIVNSNCGYDVTHLLGEDFVLPFNAEVVGIDSLVIYIAPELDGVKYLDGRTLEAGDVIDSSVYLLCYDYVINGRVLPVFLPEYYGKYIGEGTIKVKAIDSENKKITLEAVQEEAVAGDANGDGEFGAADVITVQKWLIGKGGLTNWKNADLCSDGKIDIFDLCLMRKELVGSRISEAAPLLMITDQVIGEDEKGWIFESYLEVIDSNGCMHKKKCSDYFETEKSDWCGAVNSLMEIDGTNYIENPTLTETIAKFVSSAEKYKDTGMSQWNVGIADWGEQTLYALYTDENGDMKPLELCSVGGLCQWLDDENVKNFVALLIRGGYFAEKDFLDCYLDGQMPRIIDDSGTVTDEMKFIICDYLKYNYLDIDLSDFTFKYDPENTLGNIVNGPVFSIYYKGILLHGYGNINLDCNVYAAVINKSEGRIAVDVNFITNPEKYSTVDINAQCVGTEAVFDAVNWDVEESDIEKVIYVDTWKEVPTLAYRVIVKNGNAECIVNAVTGELIEEIPYYVT